MGDSLYPHVFVLGGERVPDAGGIGGSRHGKCVEQCGAIRQLDTLPAEDWLSERGHDTVGLGKLAPHVIPDAAGYMQICSQMFILGNAVELHRRCCAELDRGLLSAEKGPPAGIRAWAPPLHQKLGLARVIVGGHGAAYASLMEGGCCRLNHLQKERRGRADGKRDVVGPGGEVSGGEPLCL